MDNFALIVEFDVKPENLARFNELLAINAKASVEKEPGCQVFDVCHQIDDPTKVVLYEIYDNLEAFNFHMTCQHTQDFLGAAKELINKQAAKRLTRTLAPQKA